MCIRDRQVTDEVNWSAGDFAVMGLLLFGSLGLYELAARTSGSAVQRAGFAVALAAVVLLVWICGAVGILDGYDGLYLAVLFVALGGSVWARLRPAGMVRAMTAAAITQAVIAVVALVAGIVPPYNSAFEILGLNAVFVVLWMGAAALFREAAERPRDAATA